MPLFSIIIPVYNVEKYIRDCIESVIEQESNDLEIILIDDGSPDNCPQICDEYKEKDKRIKVIHQGNLGLSEARNTGIRNAVGEYLLFLDSDDFLIGRDALQRLSKPLMSQSPDLLMYLTTEYDADGKNIIFQHAISPFIENKKYLCSDIFNKIYEYNGIYVTMAQTKIIRREFLLNHGLTFKTGIYHEDDEWFTRVLQSNPEVVFSNEAVYGYRHRTESIITTKAVDKLYKRACNKVAIGTEMLSSEKIRNNPAYAKYAAQYFLGAVSQAKTMDVDTKKKFLKFLRNYENGFKQFRFSKSKSLLLYSMIQQMIGTNAMLKFIK